MHGSGAEDLGIHGPQLVGDDRLEAHVRKNICLEIDPGGDLCQDDSFGGQLEHGSFRDTQNGLVDALRVFTGKGDLLHLLHELVNLSLTEDAHFTILHGNLQAAGGQRSAEDDLLRVLGDVDEPSTSRDPRSELAHIDVAASIHLSQSKEGGVHTAAVIEVKLVWLVEQGLDIH